MNSYFAKNGIIPQILDVNTQIPPKPLIMDAARIPWFHNSGKNQQGSGNFPWEIDLGGMWEVDLGLG